jgi:hypothetical protein
MPAHSSGAATSRAAVGDAHDEALIDDDVRRVPAARHGAVAVDGAVRLGVAGQAVLLLALLAVHALAARVDHAADADAVADRMLRDRSADFAHDAGDLVARDGRVRDFAPLAAAVVDVGMADAAELDLDQDVAWTDCASLDRQRDERLADGRRAERAGAARLCWAGLIREIGHATQLSTARMRARPGTRSLALAWYP